MSLIPVTNHGLQTKVESALDRWIRPTYLAAHEHIAISVNDQGEVWLSGLLDNPKVAEEAVRIVKGLPGVRFVFNYITICQPESAPNTKH